MKRTKVELKEERQILINMITNTSFLRQMHNIAKSYLFQTSYAKIISGWIWEYWKKIEKAPNNDIQDLYLRYRSQIKDEEDLELVGDFLRSLSEQHKLNNITYAVENAVTYFKLRSLEDHRDKLTNTILDKDPVKGETLIANYTRVEKQNGSGIDLFSDTQAIIDAFSSEDELMFSFPGQLGKSIGPFCRGDFFAILGAMKRGKSFWMWYTARRAALMGFKAIHFSLEMTEKQIARRSWQSFIGQPRKAKVVKLPEFIQNEDGDYDIEYRNEKKKGVDLQNIEAQQKKYRKELRDSGLRIEVYPSYNTALSDIQTCLANLEYYDNFIPDVIVIDYADILMPESKGDYRHQLNSIWATMRGWAQSRNCLVVTGSQTDRKSLEKDTKVTSIAEDVRKLAHVTKMIALNQTNDEREEGVMRIKPLLNRDGRLENDEIVVLENREISRIYLDSQLKSKVTKYS